MSTACTTLTHVVYMCRLHVNCLCNQYLTVLTLLELTLRNNNSDYLDNYLGDLSRLIVPKKISCKAIFWEKVIVFILLFSQCQES